MKKYIYCVAIAILTIGLLTGCGSGIELSDQENAMVAEYMATALLKYDSDYEDELIYAEAAETEETFTPVDSMEDAEGTQGNTEAAAPDASAEGTQGEPDIEETASVSLSDIFNSKKYEVTYMGAEEYQTYKEEGNDYFIVEAPSGCKLLVLKFEIKNTSSKDITVSLADKGITYELEMAGASVEKPLLTALMEDLQYYNETIPAGESKAAAVVFAVDKKADASKGTLRIIRGDKRALVSLQ